MEGLLFVLSGPSGVGKNTVLKEVLAKRPDLTYSISATTRPPRGQEVDGVNYYFLTEEQFLAERQQNGFLEWAEIYGHYYGTPKKQVLALLQKGQHVILDVDIQGAAQIRQNYANAVLIFLYPPSIAELIRRLRERNTEDEEAIRKRLAYIEKELAAVEFYDYVVVNDRLDEACMRVESIINAEEVRVTRGYWKRLLNP
ncbi:MAG TPA: guanylate kinase [Firmicutes bacterium]|uniref:Guanylate kinase n=1 Tax=Capillibacterium thermochitinicola TaxID=2699427 RepID=A0A8J6I168_9FIRM|nr:guanylate kinase [Capillibacterium thermochitinicola]MBA2133556.1 guanylate kinase [Capillibacterium thermochitinicola]HHW12344.1 guanylate kinase [Bacillota bacterium]